MTDPTPPPRSPTGAPSAHDRADDDLVAAQRYVKQLQVFYVHTAVFAGSMAINFLVNLLTNLSAGIADEWSAWWSLWALLGWSAGLAVHGLVLRLNRPSLSGPTWEQRQVDKILSK